MAELTSLDIVVLLLLGGGAIFGGLRGFVTEAISLIAWVAAVLALNFFYGDAVILIRAWVTTPGGAQILAFAIVFGVVFVAGKILAAWIGGRVRTSMLGPVDRLLGFGFGAVKGLIIATLIFLALNLFFDLTRGVRAPRPPFVAEARSFVLLNASGRAVIDFVKARRNAASSAASNATST